MDAPLDDIPISDTILAAFKMMHGVYFREQYTRDTVAMYQRLLGRFPEPVLLAAVAQCCDECTFFPKPNEIKERVIAMMGLVDGPTALEAWGQVVGMMRHTKHYWEGGVMKQLPDRLDEITERAVEAIGGWPYLRMSEDAMADRARFCEVYGVLQARKRQNVALLPEVRALAERMRIGAPRRAPELEGAG